MNSLPKLPPFRLCLGYVCVIFLLGALCLSYNASATATSPLPTGKSFIHALKSPQARETFKNDPQFKKPAAAPLIDWLYLIHYTDQADYETLRHFVSTYPNWPRHSMLTRQAEAKLPATLRPYEIKSWFDRHPPKTLKGLRRYTNALETLGYENKIAGIAQTFFTTVELRPSEMREYSQAFGKYLTAAEYFKRADELIWSGNTDTAEALLPYLPPRAKNLLLARIMLAEQRTGVDAAIDRIDAQDQMDPGLVYERARWRRRANDNTGAISLLDVKSVSQTEYAAKWWLERHIIIRRYLEDGDLQNALQIAKNHRQKSGLSFAQAEFIVGWLNLIHAKNANLAAESFTRLYDGVSSPISTSRAAYWAGRAYEAMGNTQTATTWYSKAMKNGPYFYGQLAGDRLNRHNPVINWAPTPETAQINTPLQQEKWTAVIRLLTDLDLKDHTDGFFAKLFNMANTPEDLKFMAALGKETGRYDQSIRASKNLYNDTGTMLTIAYPILSFIKTHNASPAHVYGLIRQESVFNPEAQSFAGARGLMQLMPGTAGDMARNLGVSYSISKLTEDPVYNTRLGIGYLEQMLQRYDGNIILASAAYNAGPGRVDRWIKTFGDPRKVDIDMIDWIEMLPVYETRNYAQRVYEATRVYSYLLGIATPEIKSSNP